MTSKYEERPTVDQARHYGLHQHHIRHGHIHYLSIVMNEQ